MIRTMQQKRDKIFYVATPDTQLFDNSTNKTRKVNIKITFKTNDLQGKEL